MSALRVVLIAAALGSVVGVGLAFQREAVDREALQAVEEAPDRLAEPELSAPGPGEAPPQTGPVGLAAVEGLPQYPGAFVRPVSSGAQLNVAWFATQDSPRQVLDFYEKQFLEQGKLVVGYEYSAFAGYVGYMDISDHRMHLISVLRQGDETLVFPSTSYPEAMLEGGAQPPPGVPAIAGAEGSIAYDLGSGPQRRQVWLATFPNQNIDEVTEAWRQGLVAKGWEVTRSENQGTAQLDAKGSSGAVQVEIKKDASAKVAVYVTASGPRAMP